MAEEPKIDLASPLLENPNFDTQTPEHTPTQNAPSAIDRVILYLRTHLNIFAVPSTLCFMAAMLTFVNTQSFTSLVERVGQGNASLTVAAIAMSWFPFLYYSMKLRGVDTNLFVVKLGVEAVFFFTDVGLYHLFQSHGNALLVFLLMGCAINAADFAGIGGRVSYRCDPTIFMAIFLVSSSHWGLTYTGFLVYALLYVYKLFRSWVYVD